AIRLVDVPESRTLGLTEGIETGLAVATGYRYRINVWSLLNCGNLALADIPKGRFDKVIIFADHDHLDVKKEYRPGEHFALLLKE
ncbi:toprim domain-containing protein, partial [Campylobacter jejuni]|nr:toprim domain-containing protein [Campylobacter jejuni]